MQKERRVHCFKQWQILHAVAVHSGVQAQQVALLLGASVGVVRRTVQRYNKAGTAFMEQGTWGGRREERCLMGTKEEAQLLQSWETTALEGGVLVAKQLRKEVEGKVGHKVSQDYLWTCSTGTGGQRRCPGPNIQKRQKQKKKAPALLCKQGAGAKPLKVFFEDEARFGRTGKVSRCWVPPAKRATVKKQTVREYTYAFSAVCPLEGESYSLISPLCNTAAMNELLKGLSTMYPEEQILLFADSAGWHKSKELEKPANVHLELLPPYSPDLNPTEHLWDYIREQKGFNNHTFDSMDELETHLEEVLKALHQEKDYLKSLCTFEWMFNSS